MSTQPGSSRTLFLRHALGVPQAGGGFNKFAAGAKGLGATPNLGPVGDKSGYKERDRNAAISRNALLRRLKARQQGRFMSNDNLYGEV